MMRRSLRIRIKGLLDPNGVRMDLKNKFLSNHLYHPQIKNVWRRSLNLRVSQSNNNRFKNK
jgi:hypothetical protein